MTSRRCVYFFRAIVHFEKEGRGKKGRRGTRQSGAERLTCGRLIGLEAQPAKEKEKEDEALDKWHHLCLMFPLERHSG